MADSGLVSQRPHLLLEKFELDLDRVLHVFGLDQLVAEIESRSDIALHEVAELLGLVADRRWRGGQPFLQKFKIICTRLSEPPERLGQRRADIFGRWINVRHMQTPLLFIQRAAFLASWAVFRLTSPSHRRIAGLFRAVRSRLEGSRLDRGIRHPAAAHVPPAR